MKKRNLQIGILSIAILTIFPAIASAKTPEGQDQWYEKLNRGLLNVVTSPLEIPREIHYTSNDENLAVGWTLGLATGFAKGLVRIGAGVVDFVTCPFEFPKADKAPLLDPEFPWQEDRTKL